MRKSAHARKLTLSRETLLALTQTEDIGLSPAPFAETSNTSKSGNRVKCACCMCA